MTLLLNQVKLIHRYSPSMFCFISLLSECSSTSIALFHRAYSWRSFRNWYELRLRAREGIAQIDVWLVFWHCFRCASVSIPGQKKRIRTSFNRYWIPLVRGVFIIQICILVMVPENLIRAHVSLWFEDKVLVIKTFWLVSLHLM